ncbi:FUSC family protein [Microbacterium sp. SORGH_AS_0888]|uniref:FUSC family protein n=1 Tax=Microbacterium sp. SORGH_AS_0888 TaxID=3041791 RepID=UPI0027826EE1|nr:FUSC family protein [Microbacterium sp. SORGH_AS_0888]MDQ1128916.1 MFS family permease [Microbacterium sp. SORGH_AS_0888]
MGDRLQRIWTGTVRIAPHRGDHRVAIRAAVSVAVPLLALWALGRLDLSVYATFGAFAGLYGRFDRYADRVRMQLAAGGTMIAAMLIGTALAVSGVPAIVSVIVVAAVAAAVTALAQAARWHPPGALFAVFAAGATATLPADPLGFVEVLVVGGAGAVFSVLVTATIAAVRRGPRVLLAPAERRPAPVDAVVAATVGVGAALAGIAGLTFVGTHWYWAMVAAVAALGGPHVNARIARGVQRLAGTLAGVLVAAGLLSLHLPPVATIAVAVLCQMGAELFISRNYGIAMVFITPLALLMIELAVPADPAQLLRDRVLDTVIGVLIGTAVAVGSAAIRRPRAG